MWVLSVTRRTSFMLSGAQLGITVTGLLVGYVAEPLIGDALGEALGGVGVPTGVGVAVGTVFALLLSTLVQMLFGELFPKNLAISRPEPVAVRLAGSTTAYLTVFGWLIRVFDSASNALLRVLRIEPVHDVEHSATARDLEHIVAESAESGDLPRELSVLLDRILDFPEQDAEHAMIPRSRVDVVRAGATVGDVREQMASGHSRYPVLSADDEVLGVVHLQDVLVATDPGEPVERLMRAPELVPTSMALPDALRQLAAGRNQLACVLDEYGGFAGVLTFEGVAEEDGSWVMPGEVHVDEVERAIGRDLPAGDYETIAGLVIAAHGALPAAGDSVVVLLPGDPGDLALAGEPDPVWLRVDVLELERHVPARVRVTVPADPPPTESERAEAVERDREEDR